MTNLFFQVTVAPTDLDPATFGVPYPIYQELPQKSNVGLSENVGLIFPMK